LDKVERIRLIQRLRDALGEVPPDDQDLILDTYGIGTVPEDDFGNGPTVTAWLRQSDDQDLIALAQHFEMLDNTVEYVADQSAAGEPAPLFIFATHLSKHRAFLGEVATGLAQFGVTLFVAHDSIPVDAPWEKEIVDALNRCHAGAAFIHPGLYDSYYCMQEAGWMLGRGIPIARLMFGDTPKGLLGEKQGMQLDGRPAMEVAAAIMDWSLTHSVLVSQVAASLTTALGDSESYATTELHLGPAQGGANIVGRATATGGARGRSQQPGLRRERRWMEWPFLPESNRRASSRVGCSGRACGSGDATTDGHRARIHFGPAAQTFLTDRADQLSELLQAHGPDRDLADEDQSLTHDCAAGY